MSYPCPGCDCHQVEDEGDLCTKCESCGPNKVELTMKTYCITENELNRILDHVERLRADGVASVVKEVLEKPSFVDCSEELATTKRDLQHLQTTCIVALNTALAADMIDRSVPGSDRVPERVPSLLLEMVQRRLDEHKRLEKQTALLVRERDGWIADAVHAAVEAGFPVDMVEKARAERMLATRTVEWAKIKANVALLEEQLRAQRLVDSAKLAAQIAGIPLDGPEDQFATKVVQKLLDECKRLRDDNVALLSRVSPRESALTEAKIAKDAAYHERDQVVALLAAMAGAQGLQMGMGKHVAHPGEAPWDPKWHNIVFIDLPQGQVSWHIHDDERTTLFEEFPAYVKPWDGHDTKEKYARVASARGKYLHDVYDPKPSAEDVLRMVHNELRRAGWCGETEFNVTHLTHFLHAAITELLDLRISRHTYVTSEGEFEVNLNDGHVNVDKRIGKDHFRRCWSSTEATKLVPAPANGDVVLAEKPKPVQEPTLRDLTLRELQTQLPWTIHYHRDFRASPMTHKDFGHALLHVHKAAGKLAALVDDAEHKGCDFKPGDVDPYVADLVVCALRMANTCPGRIIDLQVSVERRIEMKNNVTLDRKGTP